MMSYQHWVLVTLIMAALPSLVHLPLWVAGIALAGGGLHYGGRWFRGRYGKAAAILLLGLAAAGIWSSFDSWFSGDAVLSFFIVVVFLKWGESHTRRDYLLLVFAAVILAAVGTLYWENLLNLLHMLVIVFLLTVSLTALQSEASGAPVLLRRSGILFALGLPVMLLLFLSFPRIPGPLWDLGLAFGLPVKAMLDRGPGGFGKAKTLQPGGIHRAAKDNENVLVAEFKGAVPFKSRLYWRGPVFWEFDGENWKLPEGWDDRTRLLQRSIRTKKRLDRELHLRKDPVRYTLRVMPNGSRWLYGLDIPAAPAPEAFISDEYQLLSIRQIEDHEPKLEMLSYLEYEAGWN
jgi:protein-glutamine gamma-glutamyltransferase